MSEVINNSQQRIERLKQIITELHKGSPPAAVRERMAQLVRETTSDEIVAMEQQLIQEGLRVEEIKQMCDLHSQVVREILVTPEPHIRPGHPVDVFRRENAAVAAKVDEMEAVVADLSRCQEVADLAEILRRWRAVTEELLEVEKHYARKENLLFPHLERHGVTGPSQVMWAKDDEIREMLSALRRALTEEEAGLPEWKLVGELVAAPLARAVREMIFKEEKILLPMSLTKLAPDEWKAIHREAPRFGYCLIEPGDMDAEGPEPGGRVAQEAGDGVAFETGRLSVEQARALFSTLPVDLTFVDDDDRVAFYSEGRERIFARTPSIIGRKVQNCHPPASVHVVQQILDDFRSGRQNVAEFWITLHGRFVHIRYFAVRGDEGRYVGTLEVTQDLTPLRALEGERRLLAYDAAAVPD
jgi:DUF438 domain-containing protein